MRTNYTERLELLKKFYTRLEKENKSYNEIQHRLSTYNRQKTFVTNMRNSLYILSNIIGAAESVWREQLLHLMEEEIANALSFVYPQDNYRIKLEARVLRNRVHIDTFVSSLNLDKIPGKMKRTQGLLFRQIVSVSAIVCIMKLRGIETIYIDEAFSGSSKQNIENAKKLLEWYANDGINLIVIAQDPALVPSTPCNILYLSRNAYNQTEVKEFANSQS